MLYSPALPNFGSQRPARIGVNGAQEAREGEGQVARPFRLLLSLQKDLGILSLSQGNR